MPSENEPSQPAVNRISDRQRRTLGCGGEGTGEDSEEDGADDEGDTEDVEVSSLADHVTLYTS